MIIEKINREEALRYLALRDGVTLDDTVLRYIDECEERVTRALSPRFLYRSFSLSEPIIPLVGGDIAAHLRGCTEAVILCATVGAGVDRLIRALQVEDMAKAVIADAFAGAAVEQVCEYAENEIKKVLFGKFFTWRYSPGYGDFPLETQKSLLEALDAPRKIGLCATDSLMLTPIKSVTAVMGVSEKPLPERVRGCVTCTMGERCEFRKRGLHCGF